MWQFLGREMSSRARCQQALSRERVDWRAVGLESTQGGRAATQRWRFVRECGDQRSMYHHRVGRAVGRSPSPHRRVRLSGNQTPPSRFCGAVELVRWSPGARPHRRPPQVLRSGVCLQRRTSDLTGRGDAPRPRVVVARHTRASRAATAPGSGRRWQRVARPFRRRMGRQYGVRCQRRLADVIFGPLRPGCGGLVSSRRSIVGLDRRATGPAPDPRR